MGLFKSLFGNDDKKKSSSKKETAKKESKKADFKDPFAKNMVKVCAGIFQQDTSYTYTKDVYPGGDHRRKPEKKYLTMKQSRRVTISEDFYICKYPVTQGQWKAIMGEGFNPSEFRGDDNLPVESVSWEECQEFIKKLNALTGKKYCLPTVAQWEWAAMGASKDSDQGRYAGCKYSDDLKLYAWYDKNSENKTHLVGQKKPNELGLYDMTGNVDEWCNDPYSYDLGTTDVVDPIGSGSGATRFTLGGKYNSSDYGCEISCRSYCCSTYRRNFIGFRLALTID